MLRYDTSVPVPVLSPLAKIGLKPPSARSALVAALFQYGRRDEHIVAVTAPVPRRAGAFVHELLIGSVERAPIALFRSPALLDDQQLFLR